GVLSGCGKTIGPDVPVLRLGLIERREDVWTRVARQVSGRASGERQGERLTAIQDVGPGQLPVAENLVPPTARVHKPPALAEGQMEGEGADERVRQLIARHSLLKAPVVERDTAGVGIPVRVIQRFRIGIERVQSNSVAIALLRAQSEAMVGAVPIVAIVPDRAELRVRLKVLSRRKDSVEGRDVARDVQGNRIYVPRSQKADARAALVICLEQPSTRHL